MLGFILAFRMQIFSSARLAFSLSKLCVQAVTCRKHRALMQELHSPFSSLPTWFSCLFQGPSFSNGMNIIRKDPLCSKKYHLPPMDTHIIGQFSSISKFLKTHLLLNMVWTCVFTQCDLQLTYHIFCIKWLLSLHSLPLILWITLPKILSWLYRNKPIQATTKNWK